jgi:hypothetical protein
MMDSASFISPFVNTLFGQAIVGCQRTFSAHLDLHGTKKGVATMAYI